jgi:hypothetical protein
MVFSTWSVPRCYKDNFSKSSRVSQAEQVSVYCFMLLCSLTLMMKAVCSSEMSVDYHGIRRYIPQDTTLQFKGPLNRLLEAASIFGRTTLREVVEGSVATGHGLSDFSRFSETVYDFMNFITGSNVERVILNLFLSPCRIQHLLCWVP